MKLFEKNINKKICLLIVSILFFITFVPITVFAYRKLDQLQNKKGNKKKIVVTTTMLSNLTDQITKESDYFQVIHLMGEGVDPHNYQTKPSDLIHIITADLLVINGLHLEAQMEKAFEKLSTGKIFKAGDCLDLKEDIIKEEGFPDPHIWFDIQLWKRVGEQLTKKIKNIIDDKIENKIEKEKKIEQNWNNYEENLKKLENNIKKKIEENFEENSEIILITSHDCFSYFCRYLNKLSEKKQKFSLQSLQGISTQDEISASRVKELISLIQNNNIKAIFTESSIPDNDIKSLKEQIRKKITVVCENGEVLYSDSLNKQNDYIKTIEHNIDIISKYLKNK
ncbi:metal ABC transporter solute-binding protein, Zn/Mn family [Candidatus Phytoplasma pini]|uniref:ABC-type Mn/Zn transport system, periplasmic component n=1 Tax=Candidatus Phytoplasma pini TaxID=267362 RepID=A0A559KJM2_9MOLU|nr:zinc ABC transporter substrate-binding protein [Candidatus Phytoplasma pini]TVY12320.1 ABC-type Mn/Zn transport system, periplasmic component [Candidatus Phytoplasma pini]